MKQFYYQVKLKFEIVTELMQAASEWLPRFQGSSEHQYIASVRGMSEDLSIGAPKSLPNLP